MEKDNWLRRARAWVTRTWARIRFPLGAFFGWLSVVFGLVLGGVGFADALEASDGTKEWVYSVTLALMAIISLVALALREVRGSAQRQFYQTLPRQHEAGELLRDLRIFLRQNFEKAKGGAAIADDVPARARKMLEAILTEYAAVYTAWAGVRCRCCLKMIEVVPEGAGQSTLYVYTLARDQMSAKLNRVHDKKRADLRADKLKDNSDFLKLWDKDDPDDGFFYGHNLRTDRQYNSSSLKYWRTIAANPSANAESAWPVWYESALVWPVRQELREDLGINSEECLGFLSVDSRLPRGLNDEEHAMFGKVLANNLFPILDLYSRVLVVLAQRRQPEAA